MTGAQFGVIRLAAFGGPRTRATSFGVRSVSLASPVSWKSASSMFRRVKPPKPSVDLGGANITARAGPETKRDGHGTGTFIADI